MEKRERRERYRRGQQQKAAAAERPGKSGGRADSAPPPPQPLPAAPVVDHTAIPDPHMFDHLKRETEDIAALAAPVKYSKRRVTSNWAKYELPPDAPDNLSDEEGGGGGAGTDFALLLMGAQAGSQHQLRSERLADLKSLAALSAAFTPDPARLAAALARLPLYAKLDLPPELFTEEELEAERLAGEEARAGLAASVVAARPPPPQPPKEKPSAEVVLDFGTPAREATPPEAAASRVKENASPVPILSKAASKNDPPTEPNAEKDVEVCEMPKTPALKRTSPETAFMPSSPDVVPASAKSEPPSEPEEAKVDEVCEIPKDRAPTPETAATPPGPSDRKQDAQGKKKKNKGKRGAREPETDNAEGQPRKSPAVAATRTAKEDGRRAEEKSKEDRRKMAPTTPPLSEMKTPQRQKETPKQPVPPPETPRNFQDPDEKPKSVKIQPAAANVSSPAVAPTTPRKDDDQLDFLLSLQKPAEQVVTFAAPTLAVKPAIDEDETPAAAAAAAPTSAPEKTAELEDWLDSMLDD